MKDLVVSDQLTEAIQQMIETSIADINTSMPGKIVSYNAATNRAIVKPDLPKAVAVGDALDSPQIVEVPIVWPASGGGSASFTMPLKAGDGVMLQFQQRSIEGWLDGKNTMPDDPRQHDLSDCVAIAGCSPGGTVAHSDDVVLKFGGTEIRLKPDGTLHMGQAGAGITIDGGGNMTLKAASIKVDAGGKTFNLEHHKHTNVQPGQGTSGEVQ